MNFGIERYIESPPFQGTQQPPWWRSQNHFSCLRTWERVKKYMGYRQAAHRIFHLCFMVTKFTRMTWSLGFLSCQRPEKDFISNEKIEIFGKVGKSYFNNASIMNLCLFRRISLKLSQDTFLPNFYAISKKNCGKVFRSITSLMCSNQLPTMTSPFLNAFAHL